MSSLPATSLTRYTGDVVSRARSWTDLDEGERRRRAALAARDRSLEDLWSLTEAHLTLYGKAGAHLSDNSRRAYRGAIAALLTAWSGEGLLRPGREAAPLWLRAQEAQGLKPTTVQVRLAGARALYRALRWSGATDADPFADAKPARDPTPAHERRHPYDDDAVERLLAVAEGADKLLVLLGAHSGLRASEIVALRWEDLDLDRRILTVQKGKGGKRRSVPMSRSLTDALTASAEPSGRILPYRSTEQARYRMRKLCRQAGVKYIGLHALRHTAGTRLYRQTGRLEDSQHMLGHSDISTTQVYARWSDERVKSSVGDW